MPDRPPESWPDGSGRSDARSGTGASAADRGAAPHGRSSAEGRRGVAGPALVLGFLVAATLLAGLAAWAFFQGGTDEGPYRPLNESEYVAEIAECRILPDGRPIATGTIANVASEAYTAVIEVALVDPEGIVIDTPRATVVGLAPGADTRWQVASPYEVNRLTVLTCRVERVYAMPSG